MSHRLSKLIDEDTLKVLPFIFHFLEEKPLSEPQVGAEQAKLIEIDFYQTKQFKTYSHYKSISKIVLPLQHD